MELKTLNLAAKYRPKVFDDYVGQDKVIKTVKGWFKRKQLPSTILLEGMTGNGKTTMAKLISTYANCEKMKACGKCKYCKMSSQPDTKFVNAGADGKVDVSRELINLSKVAPQMSRKRIIVIDECHNLTKQAEEALLTTLEQPSPYTIWILCTTEKDRVNQTLLNRAMQLSILPIEPEVIAERLYEICKLEKIKMKDKKAAKKALAKVGEYSDGQMRQGISQLQSLLGLLESGEPFTEKTVVESYAQTGEAQVDDAASDLLFALVTHDPVLVYKTVSKFKEQRALLNKLIYLIDWYIKFSCQIVKWKPNYGDLYLKKMKSAKGDAKKKLDKSNKNLIATYVNISDVAMKIMSKFNSTNMPQEQLMTTWLTKASIDDYNFTVK